MGIKRSEMRAETFEAYQKKKSMEMELSVEKGLKL